MSQIDRITDPDFLLNSQDIIQIRQVLYVSDRQDHALFSDFLLNAQGKAKASTACRRYRQDILARKKDI